MGETTTLHCQRMMPSKASFGSASFFSEQSSEGQSSKDFQYRKDLMTCNSYANVSAGGGYGRPSEPGDELSMELLERDLSPSSAACLYSEPHYDDYDGLTRRERILLRPWLESLIDSGQVPGLDWIDRDKYIFKVPWKHRSKKSWSVEQSSVFLEWAKNTGRWREGDPEPNYAQLKTRLRCAFNKAPDIQEVKELHKTKCEDAYKVYRFVPKKESRFGSFAKKKMLIPTSIKRKRSSWLSWSKLQTAAPVKKVKQESGLVQLENIKLEPKCATPDTAAAYSPNFNPATAPSSSINNTPSSYPCSNYQYEVKRSPAERDSHHTILNSPHHNVSSSSEKPLLHDEQRYQAKYPKQNHLFGNASYVQERSTPYSRVKSQVPFQSFSDIAADISSKRNLIEDSGGGGGSCGGGGGNGDTYQNGVHFERSSFNYPPVQTDHANSRNYYQGYSQKYHDESMEGHSKNILTNDGIDKEKFRALGKQAFPPPSPSLNSAGQRLPYLESVNYHHPIQPTSFENAELGQYGFPPNAFSEVSRGVLKSQYDAQSNLYSKPQMTSSYMEENLLNRSSTPHQFYQPHSVPQRVSHDKLNFLAKGYGCKDFASAQPYEIVNGKPKMTLENQMGKAFFSNYSHESSMNNSNNNNNNVISNSQPPPLQPRFNNCHTSRMYSEGSSNEHLQQDAILNGHKEDGGQYRKSSSLTRPSKEREVAEPNSTSGYDNISAGECGREKEPGKAREISIQSSFDDQKMENGSSDFKRDTSVQMHGVVAEENASSNNKYSNKPASTNGLDLTKKNKMAVAPFITSNRQQPQQQQQQQPNKESHSKKDVGKKRQHQEDLSDQLGIPALSNIKVLDLIEWERKLIERERELLARERLMSMREKNLRELDNFLELKYKSDFDAVKNDEAQQKKMASHDPTRQMGQVNDFNRVRVTRKNISDTPPPLSPLANYADARASQGLDSENRKWLDGFYNYDRSLSDTDDDSSDLYYLKVVSNSYSSPVKSESESETKEPKRVEPLFVNSGRESIQKVLKDCVVLSCPDDVLVIGQNPPRFEKSDHQSSLVSKMDTSRLTEIDRSKVGSPEEELSKVLPYVGALNCEKILHIDKLLDKDAEVSSSDGAEESSSKNHSEPTQPEKEVKKDGVQEEVWKRRMKWLSFQEAQEKTLPTEKHWIWPVIGNLGQSKEPAKVDN